MKKLMSINIDVELLERFRVHAKANGLSMSFIISKAIRNYLEGVESGRNNARKDKRSIKSSK